MNDNDFNSSSLSSSSSSSSSLSSTSEAQAVIQDARDAIKEIKSQKVITIEDIKADLDATNIFLEKIFSTDLVGIPERFMVQGLKEKLMTELENGCSEIKENDEQNIYMRSAICVVFEVLDHTKYLYEPEVFIKNVEKFRQDCDQVLEIELERLKRQNTKKQKNYAVKTEYLTLIRDVILLFFYVVNKLNYVKYSYSIIYEWYRIKQLSQDSKKDAEKKISEITRNIKNIDDAEYKRFERMHAEIGTKFREVLMYEQGFQSKVANRLNIDTNQWGNFCHQEIKFE